MKKKFENCIIDIAFIELLFHILMFGNVHEMFNKYPDLIQSQPAITCSKLTIETLEQGVNMLKVSNKDTRACKC